MKTYFKRTTDIKINRPKVVTPCYQAMPKSLDSLQQIYAAEEETKVLHVVPFLRTLYTAQTTSSPERH